MEEGRERSRKFCSILTSCEYSCRCDAKARLQALIRFFLTSPKISDSLTLYSSRFRKTAKRKRAHVCGGSSVDLKLQNALPILLCKRDDPSAHHDL